MEKFRNSLKEWGVGKVLLILSAVLFVASFVMKTWFTNTALVKILSTSAKVDLVMAAVITAYLFFGPAIKDARKRREEEKARRVKEEAEAEARAEAKAKQEAATAAALVEIQKALAEQGAAIKKLQERK